MLEEDDTIRLNENAKIEIILHCENEDKEIRTDSSGNVFCHSNDQNIYYRPKNSNGLYEFESFVTLGR